MKSTLKQLVTVFGLFAGSIALLPNVNAEQLALPAADLVAPEVHHDPSARPVKLNQNHTITVIAKDNVGIKSVVLFYRKIGAKSYNRKNMTAGQADQYYVVLSAEDLTTPGMEYYIQAEDLSGNTLLHGYSFSPLNLMVENGGGQGDVAPVAQAGSTSKGVTMFSGVSDSAGGAKEDSIFTNKWLWIGLGAVAIAAAASGGGGGDDDPQTSAANPTVRITGPAVQR